MRSAIAACRRRLWLSLWGSASGVSSVAVVSCGPLPAGCEPRGDRPRARPLRRTPAATAGRLDPARLRTRGLDHIRNFYTDPVCTRKLPFFAARSLARLDRKLTVSSLYDKDSHIDRIIGLLDDLEARQGL